LLLLLDEVVVVVVEIVVARWCKYRGFANDWTNSNSNSNLFLFEHAVFSSSSFDCFLRNSSSSFIVLVVVVVVAAMCAATTTDCAFKASSDRSRFELILFIRY